MAVLLWWLLTSPIRAAEGQVEQSACPMECGDTALAWCEATFGRGGYMSVADCGGQDFRCVCNNASSVRVHVTLSDNSQAAAVCNWTGEVFESIPGGEYCTATTAVCPSTCAEIDSSMCVTDTVCEEDPLTGFYNFSCTTCEGRVVTVVGTNASCTKQYSGSILCDPETTCSGHGCCTRPTVEPYPTCTCYSDAVLGYWAQPQCAQCESGYDYSRNCREQTGTNIVFVLSSIATTWTMLCPNLAVPVLFVILGLARRLWDSDRSFTLTALRRARLAPLQTARRSQHSLFHSKYVPRRPAKSRCFINEPPERVRAGLVPRGPPAY